MPSVNEIIDKNLVSYWHEVIALSNNQKKKLLKIVRDSENQLKEKIKQLDDGFTKAQMQKKIVQLNSIANETKLIIDESLSADLERLAVLESKQMVSTISKAIPFDVNLVAPDPNKMAVLVKNTPLNIAKGKVATISQWTNVMTTNQKNSVNNILRNGQINGLTINEITRDLFGTKANGYKDGVMYGTRRSVESLARTSTLAVANEARVKTFEENDDIIKGYVWRATLDTRTCPICADMDGKKVIFNGVDELNGVKPPIHVNCRCHLSPITKSYKELGLDIEEVSGLTRSSMDGQVPIETNYKEWFNDQSASRQKEILGESRYKLFKEGKVSVDKFADNGRVLTIDELEKRIK